MGSFVELVFDCIDECVPTGFNDVFANADRSPSIFAVSAFDIDSNSSGGARFAIDDSDFEID